MGVYMYIEQVNDTILTNVATLRTGHRLVHQTIISTQFSLCCVINWWVNLKKGGQLCMTYVNREDNLLITLLITDKTVLIKSSDSNHKKT